MRAFVSHAWSHKCLDSLHATKWSFSWAGWTIETLGVAFLDSISDTMYESHFEGCLGWELYKSPSLSTETLSDKNRWNQAEGRLLVRAESTVHLREDGNHSELEHWSCLAHILGSVPFRVHIIFAHHGMCPHYFRSSWYVSTFFLRSWKTAVKVSISDTAWTMQTFCEILWLN